METCILKTPKSNHETTNCDATQPKKRTEFLTTNFINVLH